MDNNDGLTVELAIKVPAGLGTKEGALYKMLESRFGWNDEQYFVQSERTVQDINKEKT